jgi:hypothetical protein
MIGPRESSQTMNRVTNPYVFFLILITTAVAVVGQNPTSLGTDSPSVNPITLAEFEGRVREYTSQREDIEAAMQALPKKATAEQIAAHKNALLKKVLAARKGAVRGSIFSPDAERMIRSIIIGHYPGRDRMELKKELAEAENKTVPVKVNGVYPEAAELLEMPATLLQALPPLPKQVRYRFVGNSLLIVDRENHLIVDYMTNALP